MRIKEIRIFGLFGEYTHRIPLHPSGVTVLYGPNGVGKTTVLKMVADFLGGDFKALREVFFERMEVEWEGGEGVVFWRENSELPENLQSTAWGGRAQKEVLHVLPFSGGEPVALAVRVHAGGAGQELTNLFGTAEPAWLKERRERIPPLFISVDRLRSSSLKGLGRKDIPAVREVSTIIKNTIEVARARYEQTRQELEQSRTKRLLQEAFSGPSPDVSGLERQLAGNRKLAERALNVGIPDGLAEELPVELQNIAALGEPERRVLLLHLRDLGATLASCLPVVERLECLRDIINAQFRRKMVILNEQAGLSCVTVGGAPVALEALSAGEQHTLVMFGRMLLDIPKGTLVLLDEPEISLDTDWQSLYLKFLLRVVELSGVQVLLTTHSPAIVADYWDNTVELREPEAELAAAK